MEHYFINKEHKASDYFQFTTEFLGQNYLFHSCSDVFSKNELDYGSLVLVKTVIKNYPEFHLFVLLYIYCDFHSSTKPTYIQVGF